MPLVLLSELLGHSDPGTTKIYAYADSDMKRSVMENVEPIARNSPPDTAIWADDEDMILKLSGLK
jgi:integrase/recombinase XerD